MVGVRVGLEPAVFNWFNLFQNSGYLPGEMSDLSELLDHIRSQTETRLSAGNIVLVGRVLSP
jgi:hypothetical protein